MRYRYIGPLGSGGVGDVLEVEDLILGRVVALKVLRGEVSDERTVRFLEEAQVAAQLEHPGIMPVYDYGLTPAGRCFFTMKKVVGHTLKKEIRAVLTAGAITGRLGADFHRLMELLRRTFEAVAYAHARGVVHRDLKPANVMIGTFGEVLVLDWGLAKVVGGPHSDADVATVRSVDSALVTQGNVGGTPAYMAPEQALGQSAKLGPTADVWAAGVMLYRCLCGRRPFVGKGVNVLRHVLAGEIVPPEERGAPWRVPADLSELTMACLQRPVEERIQDASAVAAGLSRWLDGVTASRRALECVAEAREQQVVAAELRAEAERRDQLGQERLASVAPDAPESRRWSAWREIDAAEALQGEVTRLKLGAVRTLRDALQHDPGLPEAHDALAVVFRAAHEAAEARGDVAEAARHAADLQAHDLRGEHARYLDGGGALTLRTERPVPATLIRVEVRNRRLVEVVDRALGMTPIVDLPLDMGSWAVRLGDPPTWVVPVHIHREAVHDGVAPDGSWVVHPLPVLSVAEAYVPAGPALLGHDASPHALPTQRAWVDAFVIRRHPVTFGALTLLLDWLDARGRPEEADEMVAREERGLPMMARQSEGWKPIADPEGWTPSVRHPVFAVTAEVARRYAALEAERTRKPWRLPTELEWEKAARGVDGRAYPWGNSFEPSRARTREGRGDECPLEVVEARPRDRSVYGVMGMTGNVTDWATDGERVMLRGGAWNRTAEACVTWYRWDPMTADLRTNAMGCRLVRSL